MTAEPICTCPETDQMERATRYTVAASNLEPHAMTCPRWGHHIPAREA